MSNFEHICTIPTDLGVNYTKFRSKVTGLTVMLADIEAPLVHGYFVLATESFDDFGCPHTLEHLVFLGSEQYPYKGVLDSLANRALARGTNAWTDVDHTCYTIETAGSQGFLKLLPIYVDHILYPTLTESGCHTEVHHINGEGEDAGVVYSEMQSRQNGSGDKLDNRMKRLLHPETCGYRYETGGLMERLRELSVQKIRDYHKAYYRPDNLCLIITGKVDQNELLKALEPIEESIIKKGELPPMQRPWVSTGDFPNIEKNIEETVLFAEEDESMGIVSIGWIGPMYRDFLAQKELEVLNAYLSDSPVSVLQKQFVETEDPLCTDISFFLTDHLKSTVTLHASDVPTENLENFPKEFFKTLNRIVDEKDIDMARMSTVIEQELLKLLNTAETEAHDTAAGVVITDFLYGSPDGSDLKESVRDKEYLEAFTKYTVSDWLNVLKTWYIDPFCITLYGKPSAEFAEKQNQDEEDRIEKQRTDLGEEKLKELQQKLDDATAKNDMPIPDGLLEGFKIPPASSIQFINVVTARNGDTSLKNQVQEYIDKDNSAQVPLFIQFDHIKSHFVKISAYVNTSSLPSDLRPYGKLFLNSMFCLPIERDGQSISYEEVVKGLDEDTFDRSTDLGSISGFRELAVFNIKAKLSKYEESIKWLHDILWNSEFTVERLKVEAINSMNVIPQNKRDGRNMAFSTLCAIEIDPKKSFSGACNVLYQEALMKQVLEQLENEPETVLSKLNEFRSHLINPENFRIHVIGDILSIPSPLTAFKNFVPAESTIGKPLAPIMLSQQVLSNAGLHPRNYNVLVNLPAIENTFSVHSAKGPSRFDDPDIAPLLVMIELLETMEGIFWKLIRGQGLAYSCSMRLSAESGLIVFSIYRSPDAGKAFEKAKSVIEQLAKGEVDINASSVDGAKSGVIFACVNKESTIDNAAELSFANQTLKKMPASYNRDMMLAVQAVTMDDLKRVLGTYLVNLFKPETSNFVATSTPNKITDLQNGFEKMGFGSVQSISLKDITPEWTLV